MTLPQLLLALNAARVRLTAVGRDIQYRAPAGAMTPALVAGIRRHKFALLDLMRDRVDPRDPEEALAVVLVPLYDAGGTVSDHFRAGGLEVVVPPWEIETEREERPLGDHVGVASQKSHPATSMKASRNPSPRVRR